MKFTLEIELGNDAMRTFGDLHAVLGDMRRVLAAAHNPLQVVKHEDDGKLRDANGNTVGKWEIREDKAKAEPQVRRYEPDPELAGGPRSWTLSLLRIPSAPPQSSFPRVHRVNQSEQAKRMGTPQKVPISTRQDRF